MLCCLNVEKKVPPTEFIVAVRKCIRQFTINCLYYHTNAVDFCQTNLGMFFHFNNNNKDERDDVDMSLDDRLQKMEEDDNMTYDYDKFVYPALHRVYSHVDTFNQKYFNVACMEYVIDHDDIATKHINKLDFNHVILYLILHGRMQLSVNTVLTFIKNRFNVIAYLYDTIQKCVIFEHNLS